MDALRKLSEFFGVPISRFFEDLPKPVGLDEYLESAEGKDTTPGERAVLSRLQPRNLEDARKAYAAVRAMLRATDALPKEGEKKT